MGGNAELFIGNAPTAAVRGAKAHDTPGKARRGYRSAEGPHARTAPAEWAATENMLGLALEILGRPRARYGAGWKRRSPPFTER